MFWSLPIYLLRNITCPWREPRQQMLCETWCYLSFYLGYSPQHTGGMNALYQSFWDTSVYCLSCRKSLKGYIESTLWKDCPEWQGVHGMWQRHHFVFNPCQLCVYPPLQYYVLCPALLQSCSFLTQSSEKRVVVQFLHAPWGLGLFAWDRTSSHKFVDVLHPLHDFQYVVPSQM